MWLFSLAVIDRYRHTGIVHKQLLTGFMLLTHDRIDMSGPLTVEVTKLAVLIAVGVNGFVFLPQQVQGNAFSFEFAVDM